jgi:trehalose 6-phosphate phosphatase
MPASTDVPLAEEIARAARRRGAARVLVLDLDGTLAPIAARPRDARVPAGVLDALSSLHRQGWRVAIVTGRPAVDARRMVPIPGVAVFGSHGIEREGASRFSPALVAASARAAALARAARGFVRAFPGVTVERKPFGCAFHYRALPAAARASFLRELRVWLSERDTEGLELLKGKGLVELRPDRFGKGAVVRDWPATRVVRGNDPSFVAIGDDVADEELFAEVNGRGLTVRVGSVCRATFARRRLPGVLAVARLLATLVAAGDERRGHGRT